MSRLTATPAWRSAQTTCGLFGGGGSLATLSTPAARTIQKTPSRPTFTPPRLFREKLEPDLLPFLITGQAAPFSELTPQGSRTKPLAFLPGAFAECLAKLATGEKNADLLMQHDAAFKLGDTRNGTLRFVECAKGPTADCPTSLLGLRFAARLPNDAMGRFAARQIYNGVYRGCSLLVDYQHDEATRVDAVKNAEILEVSLLQNPAFPETWVKLNFLTDIDTGLGFLYRP